jgi:hypothetical protein
MLSIKERYHLSALLAFCTESQVTLQASKVVFLQDQMQLLLVASMPIGLVSSVLNLTQTPGGLKQQTGIV